MDNIEQLIGLGEKVSLSWMPFCRLVLDDERFRNGIASAAHHPSPHQEPGGLVLHTLEVAKAAVELSGENSLLASLAYVSSVFHDYGKIHEYEYKDGQAIKLPFSKKIGHVVWSWKFFLDAAQADSRREDIEEIGHALLAHHGRREWGSPVEPNSWLAYILHTADMLSSRGIFEFKETK